MIIIKPDFYDKFKCIASECSDNCCIGWEIDIDENTKNKYDLIKGDFSKKLKNNIEYNGENFYFKLGENERCPFLNQNNLCEIIINCGEDHLCDICREHPRFYEWDESFTDMGLGLCCEEVCRLIFENKSPLEFIISDDNEDDDNEYIKTFISNRQVAFDLIKNRELSFKNRITNLINFTEKNQNEFFTSSPLKSEINISEKLLKENVLSLFEKCEPYDENYSILISKIKENFSEIESNKQNFYKYLKNDFYAYEKLLTYILFRYYSKSLYDGDLQSKIGFSLINLWFVECIDILFWIKNKSYTEKDRINIVKYWSKEIEYSDENVEFLISELIDNSEFNNQNLINLF